MAAGYRFWWVLQRVIFSLVLGVSVGLLSGYAGGWLDTILMRLTDIQLTIPSIMIALLVDGIARAALPGLREEFAIYVIISCHRYFHLATICTGSCAAVRCPRRHRIMWRQRGSSARPNVVILVRHILTQYCRTRSGPCDDWSCPRPLSWKRHCRFLASACRPQPHPWGALIRIGNEVLFSGGLVGLRFSPPSPLSFSRYP